MIALLIVTYSLAGIFILVSIVGSAGMTLERFSIPPVPRIPRIAALGFGILFLVVALFFTVIIALNDPGLQPAHDSKAKPPFEPSATQASPTKTEPSEPPNTARPHVTFAVPSDGGVVQYGQEVQGTIFGIPFDRRLWIVVQPQSRPKYHPQASTVSVGPDGKFETRAYFGTDPATNRGEKFILMAVVTSRAGTDEIARYLEDGARMDGHFPGLPVLPSGAEIVSQLTVTRQ